MKDYPETDTTQAWVKTANVIKEHSDAMVDQWNKEIDELLTFVSTVIPVVALPSMLTFNRVVFSPRFSLHSMSSHISYCRPLLSTSLRPPLCGPFEPRSHWQPS